MNKNNTEVLIDGRKYKISGFESDEYLQQIASYINRKIKEFKKKEYYGRMDRELRNILLAINLADDYYKARKKEKDSRADSEAKDKAVMDMKHEIIDMQEKGKKAEQKMKELQTSLDKANKRIIELETRLKQKRG